MDKKSLITLAIGHRGGIYKTSYDNVTINLKAGGLNQERLA